MPEKMTLSVREAAALLGVSHTHIHNKLIHRPDFPAFRIGNRWVISRELLDAWVKKQCEARAHIDCPEAG